MIEPCGPGTSVTAAGPSDSSTQAAQAGSTPTSRARRRQRAGGGRGQRADADRHDRDVDRAARGSPRRSSSSPRPPSAGPPRSPATRCRRARAARRRPSPRCAGRRRRSCPRRPRTCAPSPAIASMRAAAVPAGTRIVARRPAVRATRATARPWLPSVARTSSSSGSYGGSPSRRLAAHVAPRILNAGSPKRSASTFNSTRPTPQRGGEGRRVDQRRRGVAGQRAVEVEHGRAGAARRRVAPQGVRKPLDHGVHPAGPWTAAAAIWQNANRDAPPSGASASSLRPRTLPMAATEALVFDAIRTPRGKGKSNGSLHATKPVDLVVGLMHEMLGRHDRLDPNRVDDVVLGCVSPDRRPGRRHRQDRRDQGGAARHGRRRPAQPLLRLGPGGGQRRRPEGRLRLGGPRAAPAASSRCRASRWAPTAAPGRWTPRPTTTRRSSPRASAPT